MLDFLRGKPAKHPDQPMIRLPQVPVQTAARVNTTRELDKPVSLQVVAVSDVSAQPALSTPQLARDEKTSGLVMGSHTIMLRDEITQVSFYKCINSELKIMAHLASSLAVLQQNQSGKSVILLVAESITQEQISEICALIERRGYQLATDGVQAWRCAASLIHSVTEGQINGETVSLLRSQQNDSTLSALWTLFLDVVRWAYQHNASDIHFVAHEENATSQIYFTIDGRFVPPERWKIPTDTMYKILGNAWQRSDGGMGSHYERKRDQQCLINVDLDANTRLRLRWSGYGLDKGSKVTFRIQRLGASSIITGLGQAGYLPSHIEVFERLAGTKGGMVTFAGTVGSGKSQSLALLMAMMPKHYKCVSLEDPVEIDIPNVFQRTIARDLFSSENEAFKAAVSSLLRSAFDVLLLGEIRDSVTGGVAESIVLSGHGIYTTTHADSALGIFSRFTSDAIGMNADVLGDPGKVRLNIYQSLILKNCPHCSMPAADVSQMLSGQALEAHLALYRHLEELHGLKISQFKSRNPLGCKHCRRAGLEELSGYGGRTVVSEMVEPDESMCRFIMSKDMLGLKQYWAGLSDNDPLSDNFTGKSVVDVALYKALSGQVDPAEIQRAIKGGDFASMAAERRRKQAQIAALERARPKLSFADFKPAREASAAPSTPKSQAVQ